MPLTNEERAEYARWLIRYFREMGFAVVPIEPTPGLLKSMALRYDHGIFAPVFGYDETAEQRQRRIDCMLNDMRKVHEEIVGTGFYKPDKEDFYNSLAESWDMSEAGKHLMKDAEKLAKEIAKKMNDLQKD